MILHHAGRLIIIFQILSFVNNFFIFCCCLLSSPKRLVYTNMSKNKKQVLLKSFFLLKNRYARPCFLITINIPPSKVFNAFEGGIGYLSIYLFYSSISSIIDSAFLSELNSEFSIYKVTTGSSDFS